PNEAIALASPLVTASPAGLRCHTPISQTASTPAGVTASQSDAATSASVSRRPAARDSEVSQTAVLTSYITGLAGHPVTAFAPATVASEGQTHHPCALPPIRHSSAVLSIPMRAGSRSSPVFWPLRPAPPAVIPSADHLRGASRRQPDAVPGCSDPCS